MKLNIFDSLINLISGMGTGKDKATYTQYVFMPISKPQLDAAYRGDWIARKAVDIPAFDSTRKWRSWIGDSKQIEQIENFERDFFLQQKLMTALVRARLYGGAALVMGVKQGMPEDELDVESLGKDCLEFVHAVSRYELQAGPAIDDILSPWYGEPSYYERKSMNGGIVRIHPSRVVRLLGNEVPDPAQNNDGWGDSILQSVDDAIRAAGMVSGGIATMVAEAKIDVIRIPGLTKNVQTQQYQDRLTTRFQYANQAKSIINTLVLDKDEEWERITTSFNTLPDVLKVYLLIVCGAVDIPATRFLSQSPAGLSSTGESDSRNYYDRLGAEQATKITPAVSRLDEVVIRSVLGTRDPSFYYKWNSLWEMDEAQRATINKTKADAFKIDCDLGLINPDALREARIDQLIEDGVYPGFEQIVEDYDAYEPPDLPEPQPGIIGDPNDPAMIERQKQLLLAPPPKKPALLPAATDSVTEDAEPRTLYMRRDVINTAEIVNWARSQGFKNIVDDLHVTIVYSRAAVDWMKVGSTWSGDEKGQMLVQPGGARLIEELGDKAITLLFASSELCWRHEDIIRQGGSHDYPDFQPHITITYDPGEVDITKVVPYRGKIVLGPEIFEEIDGKHGPSQVVERSLDGVPAFNDAAFQQRMNDFRERMLSDLRTVVTHQPVPVVNVHIAKSGKVIKDVIHDEKGRAVRITETEEEVA